jgi:dihydrolipoamide dehydrogenase
VLSEVREAGDFGIQVGEPTVDFAAVIERRAKVVATLTGGVSGLFKKNKIELIAGEASLTAAGTVRVGADELSAKTVILATGSVPRALPGIEFGGCIVGTEEAWAFKKLPARLAVVGAGASGAEIASAYARLGSETLLFEVLDRVLPTEDIDISKVVGRGLSRQGIAVHTETAIADVKSTKTSVSFTFGGEKMTVDWLVIAAGRGPDVSALGLDAAGIKLDERGLVAVDGAQRTSRPGVFAIGDIVAGPALAHKASDEGIIAVEAAAGLDTHPLAYEDIPRATFCTPNVASFGLTEAQARERGFDVVVGKVPYGAVGAGTIYGDRTGMVKIVGERRYGEMLGGHIVGTKATELIQELVNVRALEGGYSEVAHMVHGHPTLSEAVMEAARDADGWLIHG